GAGRPLCGALSTGHLLHRVNAVEPRQKVSTHRTVHTRPAAFGHLCISGPSHVPLPWRCCLHRKHPNDDGLLQVSDGETSDQIARWGWGFAPTNGMPIVCLFTLSSATLAFPVRIWRIH